MPGRQPGRQRAVDGILLLDKARGISSNQALQRVKRLFQAGKAGHCGSLDPLATGLLPICLGQATKFSSYLLGASKGYRASCELGLTTTTGDAEGEVLEERPVEVDRARLDAVLAGFVGALEQVPPMYSALHFKGQRLYQLARAGQQVERAARPVTIHELRLVDFDSPRLVIDVRCSKGTYIRSLAQDIGERLGCGAHLGALRRTAVGNLRLDDALTLGDLERLEPGGPDRLDRLLLPLEAALEAFPRLELDAAQCRAIRHGKTLKLEPRTAPGLCRLWSPETGFIGLGELAADGLLKPKRLMNTAR